MLRVKPSAQTPTGRPQLLSLRVCLTLPLTVAGALGGLERAHRVHEPARGERGATRGAGPRAARARAGLRDPVRRRSVLRVFPLFAFVPHAQGSSGGVLATMPIIIYYGAAARRAPPPGPGRALSLSCRWNRTGTWQGRTHCGCGHRYCGQHFDERGPAEMHRDKLECGCMEGRESRLEGEPDPKTLSCCHCH